MLKKQERLKVKLEDRLNIFTKEAILEDLNDWEDSFKENVENEMSTKRERIWFDFKKMDLEKWLKIIGKVEMNEQEKMFLALRKNVWIQIKELKKKQVSMDVENILCNEKKEEEEYGR